MPSTAINYLSLEAAAIVTGSSRRRNGRSDSRGDIAREHLSFGLYITAHRAPEFIFRGLREWDNRGPIRAGRGAPRTPGRPRKLFIAAERKKTRRLSVIFIG
ncbi:hypothetical protein EVAR_55940_1 [Eumeta japonica]|uniref:Uncharacterized protein n=1 Tax=Eumeta variegata TaxID=151549 RepID=A0A4C1YYV0_EUMVA|nr:hypothetical protein EVAR_55940_1 [Eumeta japonica]